MTHGPMTNECPFFNDQAANAPLTGHRLRQWTIEAWHSPVIVSLAIGHFVSDCQTS
jgi:hypothetical protein